MSAPFGPLHQSPVCRTHPAPLTASGLVFGEWGMEGAAVVDSCIEPDSLTDIILVHPIATCQEGCSSPIWPMRKRGPWGEGVCSGTRMGCVPAESMPSIATLGLLR